VDLVLHRGAKLRGAKLSGAGEDRGRSLDGARGDNDTTDRCCRHHEFVWEIVRQLIPNHLAVDKM